MSDTLKRASRDPIYFGHAFLGWHAFPAQAVWLLESTTPQNWCRAGNRWGKTESIAIKHLWNCTFKHRKPEYAFDDPYQTVNCALSLDQASLPIVKAWRLLHKPVAENFRKAFISRYVHTPFPRIEFRHGAVWWARSTVRKGVYLEGHDFDYASIDEGAFDPDLGHIIDQVLSLRLLDRGGAIDAISTGKRGSEFNRRFEMAKRDENQFAMQGKTTDNPTIDQDALRRVMATLDAGLIEERIMGGERPSDGMIPYASIMRAIQAFTNEAWSVDGWQGFAPAGDFHRYSTGWDIAKENDYVVGWTFDVSVHPFQLVAWEKFNKHSLPGENRSDSDYWDFVVSRIRQRHSIYGGLTTIDATGLGVVVADHLADIDAEALVFTGQRLAELIGCLTLGYGLGIVAHPHLEMETPDGRLWTFTDELEEVSDQLGGLDTATAEALALWGVRDELRGEFPIQLGARVKGVRS